MKTQTFAAAFLFLLTSFAVKAQDLIYKKNNEVIMVKILEIGVDEIKYKEYNNQSGPTFAIDKNEISRIKYENGKVSMMTDNVTNPNIYADNKKNAIKIDFLAPMFGQTTFGYERSLKPGASVEAQLGIIGWGVQNYAPDDNSYTGFGATANGAFLRVGYKFIRTPDFYMKGMRYAHVLKGSYVRPELTYGQAIENLTTSYGGNYPYYYSSAPLHIQKRVQFGAIMLDFGKQWIMNDVFLVDYFVGFGYGFSSKKDDKDYALGYSVNNHAMIGPWSGTPFSFTMGLKIGILIK